MFSNAAACWFAALFGLSALAIRPDQLAALVFFAGIDRVLPFAAPPLGIPARLLMALVFAVMGGLIGRQLGRKIAISRPAAAVSVAEPVIAPEQQPAADSGLAVMLPAPAPALSPVQPLLGKAAEKLLAADITTLSPIELVERLGIAIQCPGSRSPGKDTAFHGVPAGRAPVAPRPLSLARTDDGPALRFALANLQRVGGTA